MAEQWMSIVEYARTFQVSDMTVRRRIKTGRLHAVLKEGKYFIPISVAEARAQASMAADAPNVRNVESRSVEPRQIEKAASEPRREESFRREDPYQRVRPHFDGGVVKGHPAAHKTYASIPAVHPAPEPRLTGGQMGHESEDHETHIPPSIRRPLGVQETSLVDTRSLLAYCESSLRKLGENERRQAEKFKGKLEALESQLATKDLEIKQLRQQLEDLQLLVTVLDTKRR